MSKEAPDRQAPHRFAHTLALSGIVTPDEMRAFLQGASIEGGLQETPNMVPGATTIRNSWSKGERLEAQILSGDELDLEFVLGDYALLEKIGAGGMGMVFKARHRRMKRVVALKILPPMFTESPQRLVRFEQEVEAAARLQHPNVVTAFDAREDDGIYYLVMEYVPGTDLAKTVQQHGRMSVSKSIDCLMQAAEGLSYAHNQGIIHRDIKPANLLLASDQTVKILDMGLAMLRAPGTNPAVNDDGGEGVLLGTVDFMAPEQALDSSKVDARSDIYSLGCTFFYLLTGKAIYAGDSILNKIMAHSEDPIPELSRYRNDVPPELEQIFVRMVAKNPLERYSNARRLLDDLKRYLADRERQQTEKVLEARRKRREDEEGSISDRPTEIINRSSAKTTPVIEVPAGTSGEAGSDELRTQAGTSLQRSRSPAGRIVRSAAAVALVMAPLGVFASLYGITPTSLNEEEANEKRRAQSVEASGLLEKLESELPLASESMLAANSLEVDEVPASDKISDEMKSAETELPATEEPVATAKVSAPSLPKDLTDGLGIPFVLIPAGKFEMGSPKGAAEAQEWELPAREVSITRPFYLSQHEVTVGEFRNFVEATGYQTTAEKEGKGGYALVDGSLRRSPNYNWRSPGYVPADNMPVTNVSWFDARAFCEWAGHQEKKDYRLPTEAEWEYACRSGLESSAKGGELGSQAWYAGNSGGQIQPVATKGASAFGTHDMQGNVWEWCSDWFARDAYKTQPSSDPMGPHFGDGKVLRGGAFLLEPTMLRAAERFYYPPNFCSPLVGFRVARDQ